MNTITEQTHRLIYIEAGNGSHYGWKLRDEPLGKYEFECPNWIGPKDPPLTYERAFGSTVPNGVKEQFAVASRIDSVLIETVQRSGAEWGVSLNGPNPDAQDYYACTDKEHAKRLFDALTAGVPERVTNPGSNGNGGGER